MSLAPELWGLCLNPGLMRNGSKGEQSFSALEIKDPGTSLMFLTWEGCRINQKETEVDRVRTSKVFMLNMRLSLHVWQMNRL